MQRFLRDRKGADRCALVPVFAGFANTIPKQDSVREIMMVSDDGGIDNALVCPVLEEGVNGLDSLMTLLGSVSDAL